VTAGGSRRGVGYLTLEALLARSDIVLMDLRGFSRANRGCVFELQKLVNHGKLERTLFVLDDRTDRALLNTTLAEAASGRSGIELRDAQVVSVSRQTAAEFRGVVRSLRGLAQAWTASRAAESV
jgi:nucleoside 2-deoxyribosyltransferase